MVPVFGKGDIFFDLPKSPEKPMKMLKRSCKNQLKPARSVYDIVLVNRRNVWIPQPLLALHLAHNYDVRYLSMVRINWCLLHGAV